MVTAAQAGERLDKALPALADGLSRTLARKVIAMGGVYIGHERCKVASRKVWPGDCLTATWHPDVLSPPRFELNVVHEDARVIVVDKPPRQHVQGTAQGDVGTLTRMLQRQFGDDVQLAHRLDAPASGLVIAGRDAEATAKLMACFRVHDVTRAYLAAVSGSPEPGPCRLPLARDGHRMRIAQSSEGDAVEAHTDIEVLWQGDDRALVRARLHTGRMHQVRAHLAGLLAPLLGDRGYGGVPASRLCLHGVQLRLAHPSGEGVVDVVRLPPEDFWEAAKLPEEARQAANTLA